MGNVSNYVMVPAHAAMTPSAIGVECRIDKGRTVATATVSEWSAFARIHQVENAPQEVCDAFVAAIHKSADVPEPQIRKSLGLPDSTDDGLQAALPNSMPMPPQEFAAAPPDLEAREWVIPVDGLPTSLRMILVGNYQKKPDVTWIKQHLLIEGEITVATIADYHIAKAEEAVGLLYLARHVLDAHIMYRLESPVSDRLYPTLSYATYSTHNDAQSFTLVSLCGIGVCTVSQAIWVADTDSGHGPAGPIPSFAEVLSAGLDLCIGVSDFGPEEIKQAKEVEDGTHFRTSLLLLSHVGTPLPGSPPLPGFPFSVARSLPDQGGEPWSVVSHRVLEQGYDENTFPGLPRNPLVRVWCPDLKRWGLTDVRDLAPANYSHTRFDDVQMKDNHRAVLQQLVQTTPASLKVNPCAVVLLWGPPGTGKTTTAEAFANECSQLAVDLYGFDLLVPLETPNPAFPANPSHMPLGMQHMPPGVMQQVMAGHPPVTIRTNERHNPEQVLHLWRERLLNLGVMLIVNEADSILYDRSVDPTNADRLSTFLRFLDTVPGFVILTTNRPEALDPAVLSRVAISLHFDKLDTKAKKAIWLRMAKQCKFALSEEQADGLAALDELDGRQLTRTARMFGTFGEEWVKNQDVQQLKDLIASVQERPKLNPGVSPVPTNSSGHET